MLWKVGTTGRHVSVTKERMLLGAKLQLVGGEPYGGRLDWIKPEEGLLYCPERQRDDWERPGAVEPCCSAALLQEYPGWGCADGMPEQSEEKNTWKVPYVEFEHVVVHHAMTPVESAPQGVHEPPAS